MNLKNGMLKGVIFDMDGTLGDTIALCVECFTRCAEERTGRRPSREEVMAHFNVSDRGVLGGVLGMDPEDPQLPVARMVEIYEAIHAEYAPAPFPGAVELLRRLRERGLLLGLITGKEAHTAVPTLRHFGMEGLFDAQRYGVPTHNCKAERMAELLELWQLAPEEVVYIGDAPADIELSHRVGIRVINAAWASATEGDAAACIALHPDYRLSDFNELEPLLLKLI